MIFKQLTSKEIEDIYYCVLHYGENISIVNYDIILTDKYGIDWIYNDGKLDPRLKLY
jgi:hypothetical protein